MTTFIFGGRKLINVPNVLNSERNFECKSREDVFLKHTFAMNIFKTRPFIESKHRAFVSKIKIKISYWDKCNGLG